MLRKSFLGRLYNMKWGLVKEQILPKGYTRVAQAAMIWFGAHDRIARGLFAVPASGILTTGLLAFFADLESKPTSVLPATCSATN
jgi:hypothetical protein